MTKENEKLVAVDVGHELASRDEFLDTLFILQKAQYIVRKQARKENESRAGGRGKLDSETMLKLEAEICNRRTTIREAENEFSQWRAAQS